MRNIQHFHIFHSRIAGERHPFATVAVGLDEFNRTHVSVAVCSHKDNFSRRTGAAIARGRLQKGQSDVLTDAHNAVDALTDVLSENIKSNHNVTHADFETAFKTMAPVINEVHGIRGTQA